MCDRFYGAIRSKKGERQHDDDGNNDEKVTLVFTKKLKHAQADSNKFMSEDAFKDAPFLSNIF